MKPANAMLSGHSAGKPAAYRPDIDGLRAVAISSVFLFHLGIPGFTGGFVGVDVFFVISGMLITQVILGQSTRGEFSYSKFYLGRAWRLLPALTVTLLMTAIVAPFIISPDELPDFWISALSAALSVSNVFFYSTQDYFNETAAMQPLLHTWSLAVEAQFYLVYPLLLIFLSRRVKALWVPVLCVALISFLSNLIAVVLAKGSLSATGGLPAIFFLMPFRVFEFMIGALVYFLPRPRPEGATTEIGLGCALAAIAYCVVAYDEALLFPAQNALLPCFAAAAALHFGAAERLGQLLRNKLAVWLVVLSYSLYLVHWPIISFYHHLYFQTPALAPALMILAMTAALAAAVHYWVERPLRYRRAFSRNIGLAAAALTVALVVSSTSAIVSVFHDRNSLRDWIAFKYDYTDTYQSGRCFLKDEQNAADILSECYEATEERNIILVGDSHAAHLWYGLNRLLPGVRVLLYSASACPPVLDASNGHHDCRAFMSKFLEEHLLNERYDLVLLASRNVFTDDPSWAATEAKLATAAKNYVILGPAPIYDGRLPALIHRHGKMNGLDAFINSHLARGPSGDPKPQRLNYFSVIDAFCSGGECRWQRNGSLLVWDSAHLTAEGSVYFAERFKPWLREHWPALFVE